MRDLIRIRSFFNTTSPTPSPQLRRGQTLILKNWSEADPRRKTCRRRLHSFVYNNIYKRRRDMSRGRHNVLCWRAQPTAFFRGGWPSKFYFFPFPSSNSPLIVSSPLSLISGSSVTSFSVAFSCLYISEPIF